MHMSFLILPLLTLSSVAMAIPPVIYGEDNRQEVYEASPLNQKLAASAAIMLPNEEISPSSVMGMSILNQQTLAEWLAKPSQAQPAALSSVKSVTTTAAPSFCAGERFTNQPNPGMCSGFLIAPDLLMTAGHCVDDEDFCEGNKWVFDFKVDPITGAAGQDIKNENIYSCKRVIHGSLDMNLSTDFGLVQLDRDVVGREPLEVNSDHFVTVGEELVVIGGPSGLPLKVSGGAKVRTSEHPFYFMANLDTFQGNSGSAVFNAKTGVVEGILVRGEDDFEVNAQKKCVQAKRCKDNECRGEDVSRMTSVPEIAIKSYVREAIIKGDQKLLEEMLSLGAWVDFYGKDKVTALMLAAQVGKSESIVQLLEKDADVAAKDLEGETVLHHLAKKLDLEDTTSLEVLMIKNANIEARNLKGETPLLAASAALNLSGVKALLAAGAKKDVIDLRGASVMTAFLAAGDVVAVRELSELGIAVPASVE